MYDRRRASNIHHDDTMGMVSRNDTSPFTKDRERLRFQATEDRGAVWPAEHCTVENVGESVPAAPVDAGTPFRSSGGR